MKNVTIKTLKLQNFKGAASKEINFNESITNIYGANRTGKTTVFDAFTWLLFGKNSQDETTFSIKTLDANNKTLGEIDHSVYGIIAEDGYETSFKRIYREKWTRKRGSEEKEYTGNETKYYYNNIEVKESDFKTKVDSIIQEEKFKLLSNPYYFNSLDWKRRRTALYQLGGGLTDADIAKLDPSFEELFTRTNDLELFKRELDSKKRVLVAQAKEFPIRINELTNSNKAILVELPTMENINADIKVYQDRINEIDAIIADVNKLAQEKNKEAQELNRKIFSAKQAVSTYEFQHKQEFQKKINEAKSKEQDNKAKVDLLNRQLMNARDKVSSQARMIEGMEADLSRISAEWEAKNSEELKFDPVDESCPVCKRKYDNVEEKQKEMSENFNADKLIKLNAIVERGTKLQESIGTQRELLTTFIKDVEKLEAEVTPIITELLKPAEALPVYAPTTLETDAEYLALKQTVTDLEQSAGVPAQASDTTEQVKERRELQSQLDIAKKQLHYYDVIKTNNTRIAELQEQEKTVAQSIADVERDMHTVDEFTKTKINTIESTINSKFEGVSFKMYDELINGGEKEICETLVNGVPFADVNRAGQINAGIAIINAFSTHFGITAPIFIDNAEAVNDLTPTASQLIRLVVTTDPELVVA